MNSLQDNHYKEKKPAETVQFLKKRLDELGLEVEEKWLD